MTPKEIAKKLSSKYFGTVMGIHNSQLFEDDIVEALEIFEYKLKQMPTINEYAEWLGLCLMRNEPPDASQIYMWIKDNLK